MILEKKHKIDESNFFPIYSNLTERMQIGLNPMKNLKIKIRVGVVQNRPLHSVH